MSSFDSSGDSNKNLWIGILALIVFILAITLTLVWTDFTWNWAFLRKAYPGEKCRAQKDCLAGLTCNSGICACSCTTTNPTTNSTTN